MQIGGYLTITSAMGILERDTLMCVHCGQHYIVQPGSGKQRGFCTKCMGVTCGRRKCKKCVPLEQFIESLEKQ